MFKIAAITNELSNYNYHCHFICVADKLRIKKVVIFIYGCICMAFLMNEQIIYSASVFMPQIFLPSFITHWATGYVYEKIASATLSCAYSSLLLTYFLYL